VRDGLSLEERVLRAAETALRQQGFFEFSMRGVARTVGVHPSTIGNLFGGKQGLLKATQARLSTRA
jgi:AcrR family transcriptional regulator